MRQTKTRLLQLISLAILCLMTVFFSLSCGGGGGGGESGGGGSVPTDSNFIAYVAGYVPNVAGTGGIAVINCNTNTVETFIDSIGHYLGVAALPGGKYVYATDNDTGEVVKIDTSDNHVVARIPTRVGAYGLDCTPDGNYVYVALYRSPSMVARISVLDDSVKEITLVTEEGLELGSPRYVAITTDGNAAYVASGSYDHFSGFIGLISPLSAEEPTIDEIYVGGIPNVQLATTPDGNYLYVVNDDFVSKIKVADNTIVAEIDLGDFSSGHGIAISPDGKWVYVASQGSGRVIIIDAITDEVVKEVEAGFAPVGVAFTPDGKYAYVCSGDVYIIDVERQQVVGNPIPIYYEPLDVYIRAFAIAIVER